MENKKIIVLKHHPMNVKFTNTFYTSQTDNLGNYEIIDVTSRIVRNKEFMAEHPNFAKETSPFFIGPVVSSDGTIANIFELFWQCGKVYPCHNDNGKPNADYFKWRNEYYALKGADKNTLRHSCSTLGYTHRDTCYFAYFDKNVNDYVALNYVDARKKVYFKEYAKLVANSDSYKYLKSIVDSGKRLALVDFDAYNYYSVDAMKQRYNSYLNNCKKNNVKPHLKESDFTSIKSMKDVLNCSFLAAGHAFVLKAMLQGDIEVKDGEVIDNTGILQ